MRLLDGADGLRRRHGRAQPPGRSHSPAASRAWIWATVAATSSVLVLHMDWMDTGAPPPTGTFAHQDLSCHAHPPVSNQLGTHPVKVTTSIRPISSNKAGGVDIALIFVRDLFAGTAPGRPASSSRKKILPAVQRRDGQQVHHRQVHGDAGRQSSRMFYTAMRRQSGRLGAHLGDGGDDAHRAAQIIRCRLRR